MANKHHTVRSSCRATKKRYNTDNRKNKLEREEKMAKDVDAEIIICSHTESALQRLCKTHQELETKQNPNSHCFVCLQYKRPHNVINAFANCYKIQTLCTNLYKSTTTI